MPLFRRVQPPFGLKTLQKDPNCVLIQDPSAIWGGSDHLPRRNLLTYSQDLTNAVWTKTNTSVGGNDVTATSTSFCSVGTSSVTLIQGVSYTVKAVIGLGTAAFTAIRFLQDNPANYAVWVSNTTGEIVNSVNSGVTAANLSCVQTSAGRYEISFTYSSTNANAAKLYFYPTSSSSGYGCVSGTTAIVYSAQVALTSNLDQSYQRVTDWVTEQYAWAAQKNVPWLRRNMVTSHSAMATWANYQSFTSIAIANNGDYSGTFPAFTFTSASTAGSSYVLQTDTIPLIAGNTYTIGVDFKPTTTGVSIRMLRVYYGSVDWYQAVNLDTGAISGETQSGCASVTRSIVDLGTGWKRFVCTFVPNSSGNASIEFARNTGYTGVAVYACARPSLVVGSQDLYQRIATTWPAEYTSLALAAGYQISLYSDRAGTTATVGPDDPVGVLLDQSEGLDTSTRYGSAPGATGDYWSTPSAVANNVLGDIDLRCDVALTSWSSGVAQYLIAKDDTDTNRSYTLYITTGGLLAFYSSVLTGAAPTRSSTVATGIANGVRMWVRCTYASATGDINFYTSTSGISWTKLGGTVNAGSGALPSRSVAVTVGAASGGVSSVAAGRFYRAQVYNGISGSLVVDFDATKSVLPGRFTAATGEVWTGNGKALIVPGGYHATAPSDAARPNLRLDGNGRWYLDRDTTDDNLPITWPTNLTSTGVVYTATGDYTTKDSGLILSGATDYKYPQRPSGDYGRIVMASESKYDAKIIKYLDQKRGRAYQLGPELVSNGGFDTDLAGWGNTSAGTSSWGGGEALCATVSNGVAGGITQALTLTVGKSYLVTASLRKVSGDGVTIYITNNALSAVVATGELIAQSTMRTTSLLFAATETNNRIYCRCAVAAGTGASGYFDNVSVREILL